MKTPVLSFILLLAVASTGQAAALKCIDIFKSKSLDQVFEQMGPLRGAERKAEDWNDDRAFNRMVTEAEKMGVVRDVFDKRLDTRLYYTATGLPDASGRIPLIDPEAKAVVVFFHGSGTAQSGGANFIHNMNKLANIGVAGLSFDMPFHAEGPVKDQFNDVEYFMKWVRQIVSIARASGKPVYLFGHSFGPEIISEYAYRYPHDVDGIDLVSMVGFNPTLEHWEETRTERMKFGGEVPENALGGYWADTIGKALTWKKSGGRGDPTIANPNLKVEILWGDREEYAPAPTGGKGRTPIGRNTYDLPAAIRPFFRGANITVAPGIGHYIFDHVVDGKNVVMQSIYRMIGFEGSESEAANERNRRNGARAYWVQLEQLIATDKIFKSWLVATNQYQLAMALGRATDNENSEKIIKAYNIAYRARVLDLRHNK